MRTLEPVPTPRPYLSADQLAALTPWSVDAIRRMVQRGVLRRDVHYFQPLGRGTQLIFKWYAIVGLIELVDRPDADAAGAPPAVVPRRKKEPDVEGAIAAFQRLLD